MYEEMQIWSNISKLSPIFDYSYSVTQLDMAKNDNVVTQVGERCGF